MPGTSIYCRPSGRCWRPSTANAMCARSPPRWAAPTSRWRRRCSDSRARASSCSRTPAQPHARPPGAPRIWRSWSRAPKPRWRGATWRRRAAWPNRPPACIRTIPPCTCCSVASRSRQDGVRTPWKNCVARCGSIPWASRHTGCSATRSSRRVGSPRPWTSGPSGSAWRHARRRSWRGSTRCAARVRPPRRLPARGRMADDVKALSAELAQDPDSLVFLRLAELLRHKGQLDAAHRVALTGLERHPHLADAHDLYARILADKHDFERAFDEWDMALRIAPDHVGALKGLAFLYFKVGDVQQAAAHLEAARRVAPDDPGVAQALALAQGGGSGPARAAAAAAEELAPPAAAAAPLEESRVFAGLEGAQEGRLLLDAKGQVCGGALTMLQRARVDACSGSCRGTGEGCTRGGRHGQTEQQQQLALVALQVPEQARAARAARAARGAGAVRRAHRRGGGAGCERRA